MGFNATTSNAYANETIHSCSMYGNRTYQIPLEDCEFYRSLMWNGVAIYAPMIIIAGTIGNLLSLAVMSRSRMRKYSTAWYAIALAIADTMFLFTATPHVYFMWSEGDTLLYDILESKLSHYLFYTYAYVSVWLVVAMSVDRFVVVFFPLKAIWLCSIRRAQQTIVAIFFTFSVWFIYLLIFVEGSSVEMHGPHMLFENPQLDHYQYMVQPWIDIFMHFLIPFLILVITNSLLVKKLVQMRKRPLRKFSGGETVENNRFRESIRSSTGTSTQGDGKQEEPAKRSKQEIQMTILSVLVCVIFLICVSPSLVVYVTLRTSIDLNDPEIYLHWEAAFSITSLLPYTNCAVNFMLYCVTGQKFRREFFKMVSSLAHCDNSGEGSISFQRSDCNSSLPTPYVPSPSTSRRHSAPYSLS